MWRIGYRRRGPARFQATNSRDEALSMRGDRIITGRGLHSGVVDHIGQQIIDGVLAPDDVVPTDQLCDTFGVSRSVARDALRMLTTLGLVEIRQRVGMRVLGREHWDVLHPLVVFWRGRGPDNLVQQRELLEARLGIESVAAFLSAERMPQETVDRLNELVEDMRDSLEAGDRYRHFHADADFHSTVVEGAGNAVLTRFAKTIGAALDARGAMGGSVVEEVPVEAIDWHEALARAITRRDADDARHAARAIVMHTMKQLDALEGRLT